MAMTHIHDRVAQPLPATAETGTRDRRSFALIFAFAFGVLLAMALIAQTLGMPWRSWLPGAEGVKSVTGGVKAAVYTFMSHLQ